MWVNPKQRLQQNFCVKRNVHHYFEKTRKAAARKREKARKAAARRKEKARKSAAKKKRKEKAHKAAKKEKARKAAAKRKEKARKAAKKEKARKAAAKRKEKASKAAAKRKEKAAKAAKKEKAAKAKKEKAAKAAAKKTKKPRFRPPKGWKGHNCFTEHREGKCGGVHEHCKFSDELRHCVPDCGEIEGASGCKKFLGCKWSAEDEECEEKDVSFLRAMMNKYKKKDKAGHWDLDEQESTLV
jgi:hypothetical protein